MNTSVNDRIIVQTIVHLGASMGKRIVAEGVEDQDIANLLRDMGCQYAQGYHFARPMPLTDLLAWGADRARPVAMLI